MTLALNISIQSEPLPRERIENDRFPGIATGFAPEVTAEPLTQMSSSMRMMLLLANGPSRVAVSVGASRMSNTMAVVDGRKWNCTGVMLGSEVSCQPEKPSDAERFVLVSNGSNSTSMLHVPSKPIGEERLIEPFTEDVNVSQISGTSALDASESCPVIIVVAPAPTTGALMAFGPVWLMTESSVTLT